MQAKRVCVCVCIFYFAVRRAQKNRKYTQVLNVSSIMIRKLFEGNANLIFLAFLVRSNVECGIWACVGFLFSWNCCVSGAAAWNYVQNKRIVTGGGFIITFISLYFFFHEIYHFRLPLVQHPFSFFYFFYSITPFALSSHARNKMIITKTNPS